MKKMVRYTIVIMLALMAILFADLYSLKKSQQAAGTEPPATQQEMAVQAYHNSQAGENIRQ